MDLPKCVFKNVADLEPLKKHINCKVIVLSRCERDPTGNAIPDEVSLYWVADGTGSILMSCFNALNNNASVSIDGSNADLNEDTAIGDSAESASIVKYLKPGDILEITDCYMAFVRTSLRIFVGKQGSLRRVGEYCMEFVEVPNISEKVWPGVSINY